LVAASREHDENNKCRELRKGLHRSLLGQGLRQQSRCGSAPIRARGEQENDRDGDFCLLPERLPAASRIVSGPASGHKPATVLACQP
jgi:hypothetical protein